MADYKDTLNLPKTDFPMKGNLPLREPERLQFWQDMDLYNMLRKARKDAPKFILHDGPPYANGDIHIGHAVNKILKDTINKSKLLSGYDVPFTPGWDCHGLPIELNVEKKKGKATPETAGAFRVACREYAKSQVGKQKEDFIRLGIQADWENPYLTMNYQYEANIVRSLGKIIDNGHLHKGERPVHWCCDCQSALAEAEVEYEDKSSPAIDVKFSVTELDKLFSAFDCAPLDSEVNVVIWTTTPWTLPANQAVCLHADLTYVLVSFGDDVLVVAEELLAQLAERCEVSKHNIIARCQGQALEHIHLQHPFDERQVPVILGAHVTTDAGTGAVHTAPGHGQDDYAVGLQYDLPAVHRVGPNGCFAADEPYVGGQFVFKSNAVILDVLREKGRLLHHVSLQHSYPHCWRHKSPIIFRATPQWFISMDQAGLRQQALNAIKDVEWLPSWGQQRIHNMIVDRPDWCISRQRSWGVPIPLFVHKETQALHPNTTALVEQVAERVEQGGIDAWFDLDSAELLGDDAQNYIKSNDILDVWFDSGVSHFSVLEQQGFFPADLYLEGSDQHRGWFQSSLLTSMAMSGQAPYKQVLTHGFTVDAKGHKMSKSKGNVMSPQKVVKQLGADVLRLWVSATDFRQEMSVSDEILKRVADTYRRIRNTARYLLSNLHDFDPIKDCVAREDLLEIDLWILKRADELQSEIRAAYDDYQLLAVYQKVHHFCAVELGGFYLDVLKDRQYTAQQNSVARRSGQTAMYHLLEALVRWIAPILSFTAEEIWSFLPGEREPSVFLAQWYELPDVSALGNLSLTQWDQIQQVRDETNKLIEAKRREEKWGSNLEAEVSLYCDGELAKTLQTVAGELRFLLITSDAELIVGPPANDAVATDLPELKIVVRRTGLQKCVRCWHFREDVGNDSTDPTLCGRCVENIGGEGERREIA